MQVKGRALRFVNKQNNSLQMKDFEKRSKVTQKEKYFKDLIL